MNPAFMTLLTFLAGAFAVIGVYSILADLYLRDRTRMSRRVDEKLRQRDHERVRKSVLFKELGAVAAEEGVDGELNPSLRQRLETVVEQSGLNLSVRQLLAAMAGTGLLLGGAAGLLRQNFLLGGVVALLTAGVPLLYVLYKRKVRLHQLLSQLPEAFELMARVIRAGQTMSQAMQAVAVEFDPPLAGEFSYCYEQQNLGLSPELALRDLSRRTGLLEMRIFVLAVLVQQQTGGNLAELLDKLSTVIRERFRMNGKIRTLTAEGRFQAIVLLGLPPVLLTLIMLISRTYAQVLFEHHSILIGVVTSEVLGALWIRKIVNFDF